MASTKHILMFAICVSAASSLALADMASHESGFESGSVAYAEPAGFATTGAALADGESVQLSTSLPVPLETSARPSTDTQIVRELPATPGSASLFLSAMLSVGAYRLIRQSKHVNLSALPDWYHDDAPAQVGHAVPCDLQFVALASCPFEVPVQQPPLQPEFRFRHVHEKTGGIDRALALRIPRGPPALHFT